MKQAPPPATESRRPYKVFVSSTFLDNQERRRLVQDAITMAGMVWHGMEIFTASTHPVVEECLRFAREADLLVGIIARRYGWEPDGRKSITEMEYDAAKERLMFLIDPKIPVNEEEDYDPGEERWDKQKKLAAFKNRISSGGQTPALFTETTLQAKVLAALNNWRSDRESKPSEERREMSRIFISYASENRNKVAILAKALRGLGWPVWWDWDIPVGKTWRELISEALEAAACVVVAWSSESIKSHWVYEEAEEGRSRNILTPVLIEDVRPPLGFRQMQAANLVNWSGEPGHPEFEKLVHAIETILGTPERKERAKPIASSNAPPQKAHFPPTAIHPSSDSGLTNNIGMNFIFIPSGSFKMGSRASAKDIADRFGWKQEWFEPEKPYHTVAIARPFYIQTTPVTQRQWQQIMRNNPSDFKKSGDDSPVEQVSWEDAREFIAKLNQAEKTKDYRLPSEAEWEYACRAGSETEFYFGDNAERLGEFAWFGDNSGEKTHPVGEKKPNSWGLHDMHGNVWEWVEDDSHDSYKGAPDNGSAWIDKPRGIGRVMRGGSWNSVAQECRSAARFSLPPDACGSIVGFRLSRSVALGP